MTACTYKELSEIKFEPIAGLDDVDHEEKLADVASIVHVAIGLLGKSKEELIEFLRTTREVGEKEDDSMTNVLLRRLGDGLTKLEAMTAFVTAARWRVASAAANVYRENRRRRKRTA
jgi:hypothetical protein